MKSKFARWRQARFEAWLKQRIPDRDKQSLNRRNLFILPSRSGLSFLLVIVAIYLLAINYENNLILLFAYFLLSIFLCALPLSYLNLEGLKLTAKPPKAVFVGENVCLELTCSTNKSRFDLRFEDGFFQRVHLNQANNNTSLVYASQKKSKSTLSEIYHAPTIQLYWPNKERGLQQIERVKLVSFAPLGLFKVWTYLNFGQTYWSYPEPLACPELTEGTGCLTDEQSHHQKNSYADEFSGIATYQTGMPISRILWKKIRPNQAWQVKHFAQPQSQTIWYSIFRMNTSNQEEALSKLTWLVINAFQNQLSFGIELSQTKRIVNYQQDPLDELLIELAKQPK